MNHTIDSIYQKRLFTIQGTSDVRNKYSMSYLYNYLYNYTLIPKTDSGKWDIIIKKTDQDSLSSTITIKLALFDAKKNSSFYSGLRNYYSSESTIPDYPNVFFSENDSLVGIKIEDSILIYNLQNFGKELGSPIKNIKLVKNDYCNSHFSKDSKFLICELYSKTGQNSKKIYPVNSSSDFITLDFGKNDGKRIINVFSNNGNGLQFFTISDGQDFSNFGKQNFSLFSPGLKKQLTIFAKNYSILNKSLIVLYTDDSLFVINRNNLAVRAIKPYKNIKIKNVLFLSAKNEVIIIGNKGDIEFYDCSTFELKGRRKRLLPSENSKGVPIRYNKSFLSYDNEHVIIDYWGNTEVYNLKNDAIENTFEDYKGPLVSASFNKDNTVNLIDSDGSLVKWFFLLKSPSNTSELYAVYDALKANSLKKL